MTPLPGTRRLTLDVQAHRGFGVAPQPCGTCAGGSLPDPLNRLRYCNPRDFHPMGSTHAGAGHQFGAAHAAPADTGLHPATAAELAAWHSRGLGARQHASAVARQSSATVPGDERPWCASGRCRGRSGAVPGLPCLWLAQPKLGRMYRNARRRSGASVSSSTAGTVTPLDRRGTAAAVIRVPGNRRCSTPAGDHQRWSPVSTGLLLPTNPTP